MKVKSPFKASKMKGRKSDEGQLFCVSDDLINLENLRDGLKKERALLEIIKNRLIVEMGGRVIPIPPRIPEEALTVTTSQGDNEESGGKEESDKKGGMLKKKMKK